MATPPALVGEGLSFHRHELPRVTVLEQLQLQQPVDMHPYLTVGHGPTERCEWRASRAHHEGAEPALLIRLSIGRLGCEARVPVGMAGQHHVGTRLLENLDEALELLRAAVRGGGEPGMMPVG